MVLFSIYIESEKSFIFAPHIEIMSKIEEKIYKKSLICKLGFQYFTFISSKSETVGVGCTMCAGKKMFPTRKTSASELMNFHGSMIFERGGQRRMLDLFLLK